jgi:hypothetical protein
LRQRQVVLHRFKDNASGARAPRLWGFHSPHAKYTPQLTALDLLTQQCLDRFCCRIGHGLMTHKRLNTMLCITFFITLPETGQAQLLNQSHQRQ